MLLLLRILISSKSGDLGLAEACSDRLSSGIDLASPSELIAHERDRFDIAKHMGAEEVIYQDLDDLKACCAELSPRKDQDFEVGVFCGKYITEVPEGYFEHLDELRGKSRSSAPAAGSSTQTANGGPVLTGTSGDSTKLNGEALRSPPAKEDIRYVHCHRVTMECHVLTMTSIHNLANDSQRN